MKRSNGRGGRPEKRDRNLSIATERKAGILLKDLAAKYGVHHSTIIRILNRYNIRGWLDKPYPQMGSRKA